MSSSKSAPVPSETLAVANNHLAIYLHRLLAEEKKNVFFSPLSISTAMAMVFFAAEGETAAEMRRVLGYDDAGIEKDNLAISVQRQMSAILKDHDGYTLTSANSMLFQKNFLVKEDYKSILANSFKALLLEVNFHDNKSVIKQINDWVKEKTKGMIPSLIDSLNPNTVMVLLNAVYFKGSWLQKFDEKLTLPRKFFNYGDNEKAKVVQMMNMKEKFLYTEEDSYQALQLPYIGEDIAMLILLPNKKDGLEEIEANLTPSFIQEFSNNMRKMKVKLTLPRFRLEYSKSLVPSFQKLGVESLFNAGAELGGASDSRELIVLDIIHKAVLEVNEEGSEAAAATIVMMPIHICQYYVNSIALAAMSCCIAMPMERDPVFMVDHPFVFVIYDTKSNLILFMGRIEEL